jgi:hypothetical protein
MKRRRVLEEVFPRDKKNLQNIYTTLEVQIIQKSQEFVASEMI